MTEALTSWIQSLAAVSLIFAVLKALTPKNLAGKALAIGGCAVMCAVLISPVKSFDFSELASLTGQYEIRESIEKTTQKTEEMKNKIIEERLTSYTLQRTGEKGIKCKIRFTSKENGVFAEASVKTEQDKKTLSKLLSCECGIGEDFQTIYIGEV